MRNLAESIGYAERITALENAKIPVVVIPHKPIEGSLRSKLQDKFVSDEVIFKTDKHAFIELDAPAPHNKEGSKVLWTVAYKDGKVLPWNKFSWQEMIKDHEYIQTVDDYLKIQAQSGKSVYLLFGYLQPRKKVDETVTWRSGLQSKKRKHAHDVPLHAASHISHLTNISEARSVEELRDVNFFADIAGQATIAYFAEFMQDFAPSRFEYQQQLAAGNNGDSAAYARSLFGFDNLFEALDRILWLQNNLTARWQKFCAELYHTTPTYNHEALAAVFNFFRQSAVINATIMFPTPQEQETANNYNPVWVAPFSVANPQNILKGIIMKKQLVT